jgi:hypothetical protein
MTSSKTTAVLREADFRLPQPSNSQLGFDFIIKPRALKIYIYAVLEHIQEQAYQAYYLRQK